MLDLSYVFVYNKMLSTVKVEKHNAVKSFASCAVHSTALTCISC